MPNHSAEHMRRLASASASRRRAAKIARLIETAPVMDTEQVAQLCALLAAPTQVGGGNS